MTESGPTESVDLHCPLCAYNLRGLAEPRCPECGFAFSWDELRAAGRNQHLWLFEHGDRRNLATLLTTWWWNRLPWAFWRAVKPTNPVRVGRLLGYWVIVSVIGVAALAMPLPRGVVPGFIDMQRQASRYALYRSFGGYLGPTIQSPADRPIGWLADRSVLTWQTLRMDPAHPGLVLPVALAWPWMSVAALLVFRRSMRQARINVAHVLRVALYGCDLWWVVVAFAVLFVPVDAIGPWRWVDGVPILWLAVTCGALATVRMGLGYGRYLRFHRPLLTVLASQVLVVLAVAIFLARTTNLASLFR